MMDQKFDAVDRTLDLLEFILHHILSFLPRKEATNSLFGWRGEGGRVEGSRVVLAKNKIILTIRFVFCPRNGIVYGLHFQFWILIKLLVKVISCWIHVREWCGYIFLVDFNSTI